VCSSRGVDQQLRQPRVQQLHDVDRARDLFPEALQFEGTSFPLPTEPGLGVTFDAEAAKDSPFEFWSPPRLFREDGSYTNW